jgi:hypothetical protein
MNLEKYNRVKRVFTGVAAPFTFEYGTGTVSSVIGNEIAVVWDGDLDRNELAYGQEELRLA